MMKMSKSNVIMSLFLPESRKRRVESCGAILVVAVDGCIGPSLSDLSHACTFQEEDTES